jgi:general secretion pathway protein E
VHTNDAPSTVNRLLDMGVEDYLLTSTVIGIQAQRLVRTLCPDCNEPYAALPELVAELGLSKFANGGGDITLYHAKGCKECANTGYVGRISIIEMMPMTDPMRTLIMRHATATELRAEAIKQGMVTMYEDGMRKALRGVTTFEEVLRVTRED